MTPIFGPKCLLTLIQKKPIKRVLNIHDVHFCQAIENVNIQYCINVNKEIKISVEFLENKLLFETKPFYVCKSNIEIHDCICK